MNHVNERPLRQPAGAIYEVVLEVNDVKERDGFIGTVGH
jgi:hypothetical protein